MGQALQILNDGAWPVTPRCITNKAGGWIRLSPLEPQSEPQNLAALKNELAEAWPITSVLDMLKETDLRLNLPVRCEARRRMRRWSATYSVHGCYSVCMELGRMPACSA
jgi:hypothetical protein